jgi:predicted DNA binding CopG/RHH family protein
VYNCVITEIRGLTVPKENLDKTITIRVSSDLLARIEEEAKSHSMSRSEYGLTLLKRALGIEETYTTPTQTVYSELDKRIEARIAPLQERLEALEKELGEFAA